MSVEFFWDVASPYSYLASTQLFRLPDVRYRPFLLGGVFKATDNRMPASVPAKARYLLHDLRRWADAYAVPMVLPPDIVFPINSIEPMRVAVCCDELGKGAAYCHALFARYWGQGQDVSDAKVLATVLADIGLDAGAVLARASTQETKDRLRQHTDEAVTRGAFGAPTFFVGEQMFWGNDRIEHILRAL
jgi:2-hydroxychromene-2-carboxylate isomerase